MGGACKIAELCIGPKNTENSGEVKGDMSDLLISYLSAILLNLLI